MPRAGGHKGENESEARASSGLREDEALEIGLDESGLAFRAIGRVGSKHDVVVQGSAVLKPSGLQMSNEERDVHMDGGRLLDPDVGLRVAQERLRRLVAAAAGNGSSSSISSLLLLARVICQGVARERACAAVNGMPHERSSRLAKRIWGQQEENR